MIIEATIKVDGISKTHIHIDFLENVKLTTNKYQYEIYTPGRGKAYSQGEIVHDNDNPIELVKKVLEKAVR
jgi:hypothetical protein